MGLHLRQEIPVRQQPLAIRLHVQEDKAMTDTSLVFYCRNCGGMNFATHNSPQHLLDSNLDIHRHILECHRLDVINSYEIDEDTVWCKCDENPELEGSHE